MIVGLKGQVDLQGYFCVSDYCFAGFPTQRPFPERLKKRPMSLNSTKLEDIKDGDNLVAFISGIEIGNHEANPLALEMFKQFITGNLGTQKERQIASQI